MTQDLPALLDARLREMFALAQALARVTAEEGLALRDADIDALNEKVQRKQQIVSELIRHDTEFRTNLQSRGAANSADVTEFLKQQFGNPQLPEIWNEYLVLMRECDRHNRENSSLVNVGLRHTRQAIEFLRSCVGEAGEPVYGPRGAARSAPIGGGLVAKA